MRACVSTEPNPSEQGVSNMIWLGPNGWKNWRMEKTGESGTNFFFLRGQLEVQVILPHPATAGEKM